MPRKQPADAPAAGHNGGAINDQLLAIVQRIERVREEKREVGDDEKAIFAEAKGNGFDVKALQRLLKRREIPPHDLDRMIALDDTYNHAVGMARDLPLFSAVGAMAVDRNARAAVVDALKQLVPDRGEIILTAGGQSVRLWRDDKGDAHSEDHRPESPSEPQPHSPHREERQTRERGDVPDVNEAGAEELGRQAARDNVPVVRNPFPWNDPRRPRWDAGWRSGSGSDGMGPDHE